MMSNIQFINQSIIILAPLILGILQMVLPKMNGNCLIHQFNIAAGLTLILSGALLVMGTFVIWEYFRPSTPRDEKLNYMVLQIIVFIGYIGSAMICVAGLLLYYSCGSDLLRGLAITNIVMIGILLATTCFAWLADYCSLCGSAAGSLRSPGTSENE